MGRHTAPPHTRSFPQVDQFTPKLVFASNWRGFGCYLRVFGLKKDIDPATMLLVNVVEWLLTSGSLVLFVVCKILKTKGLCVPTPLE